MRKLQSLLPEYDHLKKTILTYIFWYFFLCTSIIREFTNHIFELGYTVYNLNW